MCSETHPVGSSRKSQFYTDSHWLVRLYQISSSLHSIQSQSGRKFQQMVLRVLFKYHTLTVMYLAVNKATNCDKKQIDLH